MEMDHQLGVNATVIRNVEENVEEIVDAEENVYVSVEENVLSYANHGLDVVF